MKTFYAALSAFALLLIMIFANVLYIQGTARELTAQLRPFLSENYTEAEMDELEAYWKRRRVTVGLSIPAENVRSIDEHLIEMRSAAACQDRDSMDTAARLALNAVSRMKDVEGFSADAVL